VIASLALLALADRDHGGRPLPDGSMYYVQFIHETALDDRPIMWWMERNVRDKLLEGAHERGITMDDWTLATFTPQELTDAHERHRTPFTEDLPSEIRTHAFVGYWIPPERRHERPYLERLAEVGRLADEANRKNLADLATPPCMDGREGLGGLL